MEISILMSRRSSLRLVYYPERREWFLYKEIDVYL